MKSIKLNIGGDLAPGDMVGVSYNNCIIFGWYVEGGQYGSLKFISLNVPARIEKQYNDHINSNPKQQWLEKKYSKGIQFRHFNRDYIVKFDKNDNRAFKISNPEEFFKDSEQEKAYLDNKHILNTFNFPAK